MSKLTSRKFWICVAAFLASVATSIASLTTGNEIVAGIGIVAGIIAAAIYAGCEAAVDVASINASTTQTLITESTSQNVEAKSDDMMTVAAVLVPAATDEPPVMEDE